MRDPSLSFAASEFLYLEVMPKPTYFGIKSEAEFYQRYFDRTIEFRADPDAIVRLATAEAQRCSMAAMDALHVAAASLAGCEILYTLERPDKPMYRTTLIRVTRITPA
jgi:predicted nucleic acid-binding protein